MKNKACINEETYKSFDRIDLSKKDKTASSIIKQNMERFNTCKTIDDVIALCHELFDDAGLDTQWTRIFFINLGRKKSLADALQYVANCYLKGANLSVNQGGPRGRRYYESKSGKKYSKEQICEAIAYWKKMLESVDESTIPDSEIKDDMELMLDVPGTDGAKIELEGDWQAIRFAVDLLTDAVHHMKAKDPTHYADVSLYVKKD